MFIDCAPAELSHSFRSAMFREFYCTNPASREFRMINNQIDMTLLKERNTCIPTHSINMPLLTECERSDSADDFRGGKCTAKHKTQRTKLKSCLWTIRSLFGKMRIE